MTAGAGWGPGDTGWAEVYAARAAQLRRWGRRAALAALLGVTVVVTGIVLLLTSLLHGGLLVLALVVLLAPVALVAVITGTVLWAGWRAWRSGAWLEAVPATAGLPWLGRLLWLARAVLAGRALRRLAGRARRLRRSRPAYAQYQDSPGGEWHQARVGDLSGTTR